uniref:Uncharacterized protein n=1 Tax=Austropuccinia psidii TaxID=181123 RepID=A0A513X005_9BASI|nr:hypothetical protein [Austropuccinia psidii]QDH07264.1 hypothetical protein [Austropuccinia psidii]
MLSYSLITLIPSSSIPCPPHLLLYLFTFAYLIFSRIFIWPQPPPPILLPSNTSIFLLRMILRLQNISIALITILLLWWRGLIWWIFFFFSLLTTYFLILLAYPWSLLLYWLYSFSFYSSLLYF